MHIFVLHFSYDTKEFLVASVLWAKTSMKQEHDVYLSTPCHMVVCDLETLSEGEGQPQKFGYLTPLRRTSV